MFVIFRSSHRYDVVQFHVDVEHKNRFCVFRDSYCDTDGKSELELKMCWDQSLSTDLELKQRTSLNMVDGLLVVDIYGYTTLDQMEEALKSKVFTPVYATLVL